MVIVFQNRAGEAEWRGFGIRGGRLLIAKGRNSQVVGALLAAIDAHETIGQTCALHMNLTGEESPGTDLEIQLTGLHPNLIVVTQFEALDLQGHR